MALCGPGIEMGGILSPCEKEGRREGARERESERGREGERGGRRQGGMEGGSEGGTGAHLGWLAEINVFSCCQPSFSAPAV